MEQKATKGQVRREKALRDWARISLSEKTTPGESVPAPQTGYGKRQVIFGLMSKAGPLRTKFGFTLSPFHDRNAAIEYH
jgi:hypothetical protein